MPKGGGAIQGIGKTFQADEFTGGVTLSIPIPTSPCRGFEPQLSIAYSSGSGNGIFGLGFGLSVPNISRKTSKGQPQYTPADTFLLSNAEDLVPVSGGQRSEGEYTVTALPSPHRGAVCQNRTLGLGARRGFFLADSDRRHVRNYYETLEEEDITGRNKQKETKQRLAKNLQDL